VTLARKATALADARSANAETAPVPHIVVVAQNSRFAEPALVNGAAGTVVAPRGRLRLAITMAIEGE
jgi:RNA polymerase sigma-70 factor (ECF subfamily)